MKRVIRIAAGGVAFALLVSGAMAQKAYKYVDEKGNVTYSQVPPAAKDAARVDISPAHSSRGGVSPAPVYPHSNYPDSSRSQDYARTRSRQAEEAEQKRIAALEAECNRARGSDCKNPETLRYQEMQNVPRPPRR